MMTKIEELKAAFEADRGLSDHCEFYDKVYILMPQLLEAVERLEFMQQTIAELASMNPFLRDVFDLNKAVLEKLK